MKRLSDNDCNRLTPIFCLSPTIAFNPDGHSFAFTTYSHIYIKPIQYQEKGQATPKEQPNDFLSLQANNSILKSIAFSPRGRYFASANENNIEVFDSKTAQSVLTFSAPGTTAVAFSPDGKSLAGAGNIDHFIRIWNLKTGQIVQTLEGRVNDLSPKDNQSRNFIIPVAFSPNGQALVSSSDNNTIKVWDLKTGRITQTLEGHSDRVNSIAFSPNGQLLASGSADKTIKVWNLKTGQAVQTYTGHSGSVNSIVFTPDGKSIASGGQDGTIKIWQLAP